jgi:hypothetical protein
VSKAPANARHLGANGCRPASVPAIGSATTREHNGSIVLPNRAIRGWVDSARRYTHVSAPAARRRQASSVRSGRPCCVVVAGSGRTRHVPRARSRRMLRPDAPLCFQEKEEPAPGHSPRRGAILRSKGEARVSSHWQTEAPVSKQGLLPASAAPVVGDPRRRPESLSRRLEAPARA